MPHVILNQKTNPIGVKTNKNTTNAPKYPHTSKSPLAC